MRFFAVFFFSFFLFFLSSCKTVIKDNEERILLSSDSINGISKKTFLLKGKKLEITEINGSLTYAIQNNEITNVIQFVYERDMDKAAYDGGYKEELVFEFPNEKGELKYIDRELRNTKMLFGRYCFCRGKTGLYKVSKGILNLKSSKNETHFDLQFKIEEVPQEINEVRY